MSDTDYNFPFQDGIGTFWLFESVRYVRHSDIDMELKETLEHTCNEKRKQGRYKMNQLVRKKSKFRITVENIIQEKNSSKIENSGKSVFRIASKAEDKPREGFMAKNNKIGNM